ncbi:MAG: 50S ribosomal protein L24 [Actinomycetia bacterium]|nr:50S ribosomal protein L24 [Actinomycetes bacterium]
MSTNSMRIRKGDRVNVISGKDKGATSVVMKALPTSRKVVVEKVAIAKKSQRPTRDNPSGGIISIEKPIHVSTVMLVCPKCNAPTRVGLVLRNGKKFRVCKKCGKDID